MRKLIYFVLLAILALEIKAFADTTTSRLGLTVPTIQSSGWGQKTNANWQLVDAAVGGLSLPNTWTSTNTFPAGSTVTIQGTLTISTETVSSSTIQNLTAQNLNVPGSIATSTATFAYLSVSTSTISNLSVSSITVNTQLINSSSINLLTSIGRISGSILQIKFSSTTVIGTIGTNSYTAAGPAVTITPKSSTSTIIVYASNDIEAGSSNVSYWLTLERNASNLLAARGFIRIFGGAGGQNYFWPISYLYLDTPGSTSAQTYSLYGENSDNTTAASVGDTNLTQYIWAIELAQ